MSDKKKTDDKRSLEKTQGRQTKENLKKDKKTKKNSLFSKKISKEKVDKEDYENKYKRALADYQNLLKQTANEKAEFAKYANEQLIIEMIPVYDNLKVSMQHIDDEASKNGWAEGIKYVIKHFKDVLEKSGIEEIEAEGKKFDHNTMEVVEGKGETVKKEVKPGYKLNGKVIIPARVILE